MIVYIAGPYSKGDVAVNVRNALVCAEKLVEYGYTPYIPHLTHFWHLVFPHEYEFWLEYDNKFLPKCDALIRLKGESSGADKEVLLAQSLKIPVFFVNGTISLLNPVLPTILEMNYFFKTKETFNV